MPNPILRNRNLSAASCNSDKIIFARAEEHTGKVGGGVIFCNRDVGT